MTNFRFDILFWNTSSNPETRVPKVLDPLASRIKTRQLVLLVNLDEQRSVLRAAQASHMTQPAASKLLGELEDTLGAKLFVRHSRGVEPTWYGEILVRHARSALLDLEHAYEEVSSFKSGFSGQVAIGTLVTSAINLVPLAVCAFKAQFPQVRVSVEVDFSEALMRGLQEGKLDMVIARLRSTGDLSQLHYEPVGEAPHAMVARAAHPLRRKRRLGWDDLVSQTWVLPPEGNVLRDRLVSFCLEQNLPLPKQVVETASVPVITSLLHLSDMVAPLAKEVVQSYFASGMLRELPMRLDLRLGSAGIITRRDRKLSPAARTMLTVLREQAAALAVEGSPAGADAK
jgi:DNA-binding transcriptional LysR family regulator